MRTPSLNVTIGPKMNRSQNSPHYWAKGTIGPGTIGLLNCNSMLQNCKQLNLQTGEGMT